MKIVKRVVLIFAVITIIIVAIFEIDIYSNREEIALGNTNLANVKKVELGMDSTQIIKIMGIPQYRSIDDSFIIYDYDTPPASSAVIQLKLNKEGELINILVDTTS